MKRIIKFVVAALLIILTYAGVQAISKEHQEIQFNKLELKSTELRAKTLELQYDEALKDLKHSKKTQKQLQEAQDKLKQLEREKAQLKEQLEAKRLKIRSDKVYASELPKGNCVDWIKEAGVTEVSAALELINRESGCNVHARNPSSGAYGIPQALPASKIAHCGSDPVCQIKWMDQYCKARYGSWAGALAFHSRNNWY